MPRFVPKREEQILAQMIASIVTRSELSDVADSSTIKHILRAAARQDDEQYYQMSLLRQTFDIDTASGDDLDERAAEIQPGTVSRIQAIAASGTVVFTRTGTVETTTIPIGTKVKAGDQLFTTTATATITAASAEQVPGNGVGRDSNPVSAVADVAGIAGNVAANTVVGFVNKPAGVSEVTNLSAFNGGIDKETDDSFRQRIRDFIASLARSTPQAIEATLLGLEDETTGQRILSVKVVEDQVNLGNFIVYVDDGSGTAETTAGVIGENLTQGLLGPPADSAVGGEVSLFLDNFPVKASIPIVLTSSIRGVLVENTDFTLNPASGQVVFTPALVATEVITADYTYFEGLIAFAQKVIDGDPNDRENFPGLRAAGTLGVAASPQVLFQNVVANIVIRDGEVFSVEAENASAAIQDYINTLPIGGDVVRSELISRIIQITNIIDVDVTTPTANINILDDQLARTSPANITIN